jgi:3-hydroxyacyl-CoA dehydrogenase
MDRRGQKNGAGYYDYDADRNSSPSPVVEAIVRELAERSGRAQRSFTADEIIERLTLPMINEGAKILDEGMAIRASDIDIIWINGYNWPAYRGGPMWRADHLGIAHVLDRLRSFEADFGPHWAPSPPLERLAADGRTFQTWR